MVEEIPSDDCVSRLVISPHMWSAEERKFIDGNVFEFPKPAFVESLVWHRYAPTTEHVHIFGCQLQAALRLRSASRTYEGAIAATVRAIRAIRTGNGDSFLVVHEPDEGVHHVHVGLLLATDADNLKARKGNLKEFLFNVFSALQPHKRP